jgi:glyceraldehyde-3-phosphate dehydrogenase/erythrose-4-phosphate dehydrogenase
MSPVVRVGIDGFGRIGRLALRAGPRSAIVDALSTLVVAGTQAKVFAWYDNERGTANRLVERAAIVARGLESS